MKNLHQVAEDSLKVIPTLLPMRSIKRQNSQGSSQNPIASYTPEFILGLLS